jgi:CRISPR system Cascade subunit CasD
MQFLAFTIFAPIASWGDVAVGEIRGTWDRPSRSAILGLVGAALGIERDDVERQRQLSEGFGVAVRVDAAGRPLTDYHTAQTISRINMRRSGARTRAQMMAQSDRQTIMSQRRYLTDSLYTILLWENAGWTWRLADVRSALESPVFALYAGRRAAPLGLPVNPELLQAETLAEAFRQRAPLPASMMAGIGRMLFRHGIGREVAHDLCNGFDAGLESMDRRAVHRDQPVDRTRWLFADRHVEFGRLPAVAEGS